MSFALGTNRGLLGVRSPLDEVYQYTCGSSKALFGVQVQNTRVRPSHAGLFLSELRFESRVQAEELLGLVGQQSVK